MTSETDTDQQSEQEATTPTKVMAQEDQQQDLEGSGTFGRSASGCGRKSLKINIPLTNPTRTIAALADILRDELAAAQSGGSKKCNPDGGVGRRGVSKTKLRHAEKMIRGAFVELYKGLGYLATYRYVSAAHSFGRSGSETA
jgi:hypothetical protein